MSRVLTKVRQLLRAIGHEIAATIRFGAIPAAAAPRGNPAHTDSAAAIAGLESMRSDGDSEPSERLTYRR